MPKAWATSLVARSWEALLGLVGFQRMATRETAGTTSLRRSNRFALSSGESWLRPVMLPPGRDRLATNPIATGSPTPTIMMGIVLRSEEHTSVLQSHVNLVCRLLLE